MQNDYIFIGLSIHDIYDVYDISHIICNRTNEIHDTLWIISRQPPGGFFLHLESLFQCDKKKTWFFKIYSM